MNHNFLFFCFSGILIYGPFEVFEMTGLSIGKCWAVRHFTVCLKFYSINFFCVSYVDFSHVSTKVILTSKNIKLKCHDYNTCVFVACIRRLVQLFTTFYNAIYQFKILLLLNNNNESQIFYTYKLFFCVLLSDKKLYAIYK